MISPIKGQFVRSSSTGRNTRTALMAGNALCWHQTNPSSAATVSVSTKPNTNIAHRYRHRIHRTKSMSQFQHHPFKCTERDLCIGLGAVPYSQLRFQRWLSDFATRSLFYNLRARLGEDLVSNVGGAGIKGVACNGSDNISDPRFWSISRAAFILFWSRSSCNRNWVIFALMCKSWVIFALMCKSWGDVFTGVVFNNDLLQYLTTICFSFPSVLWVVHCALCVMQCAMCNVHCALCDVQCAMCNVHCACCWWVGRQGPPYRPFPAQPNSSLDYMQTFIYSALHCIALHCTLETSL